MAPIPSGFTSVGYELSVIGPGLNRITSEPRAIVKPATHPTHRQRRLGRCPSGKSKIRNVPIRPTPGSHNMPSTAATYPAISREPWWKEIASVAYPDTTPSRPHTNPIPSINHPIAFSGRRTAITTPTSGNVKVVTPSPRVDTSPLLPQLLESW